MPTLFQAVLGFAGASGVGMLCLTGLYLTVSVFATNLPLVTTSLVTDTNWSAVVSLPMLVVAYVVGLLAIASVEACGPSTTPDVEGLRDPAVAPRYAKLDQEAEILSGSVVGFALLGVAAIANIRSFSGWTRTLLFTAALCLTLSFLAWKMSRAKRALAAHLLQRASRPVGQLQSSIDRSIDA
jgi:hypothetical protein